MEPGKVDEDGSIRLDALVPGAFYEPEMIGPDEIKLRRVNSPRRKMTWEEAKKAMETSRARIHGELGRIKA